MLDYYGLRHSNEGNLSNISTTVEDSWMHSLNVGHPDPKISKAGGDIAPNVKTAMINGMKVSAHRSAEVKPSTIYHAFGNEATNTAAKKLQEKYNLDYTVPSMLVQETAWRGARAAAGKDPELNKKLRESAEPKPKRTKKPKQMELF